jgi:hypothetical protein
MPEITVELKKKEEAYNCKKASICNLGLEF